MTKPFYLLAAVAGIALTSPAFAADASYEAETSIEKSDDGDYEKTTKEELNDTSGTTTSVETNVDVDRDDDGAVEKTVTKEVVEDPKGLFNKTKTTTKDTVKSEDGEVKTEHLKKVNGDVVEHSKTKE